MKVKFYQAFAFPVFTLFLALQLLFNSLNAQQRIPRFTEEEKNWSEYDLTGWQFGINLGMYLANKNSAAFYNGLPGNENNIAYILKNYYWYNEIKQELNGR
ncbi:MAG TPA: hypothetical protein PK785_04790, partial [Bacteroidales bacterium]|nr:hypothetical protein [Bacteroidales bacterium]